MTFLELCQQARLEAMVPGSGPAAVTNQTGIYASIVSWVQKAWQEIQTEHNSAWNFLLVREETLTLSAGTASYQAGDLGLDSTVPVARYLEDSFRLDRAYPLTFFEWAEFQERMYDLSDDSGRPQAWSLDPFGAVQFYPTPDQAYTLSLQYRRTPQVLTAPTDVPLADDDLHPVIYWRAVMHYARGQRMPDLRADAKDEYNRAMVRMRVRHLPEMKFGKRGY